MELPIPNTPWMIRLSGHASHPPPPLSQTVGESSSDQQRTEPTPPGVSSATRKRQAPFTAAPNFSLKTLRDCSGRNVPTNGAEPAVIAVPALSLNVVRLASVQSEP